MTSGREPDRPGASSPRPNRRRLLAVLGTTAATGLAGCLGGGDGSDGGSDGSDGGDGGDGSDGGDGTGTSDPGGDSVGCSGFTSGYRRFEPGERPFVFTCDYPEILGPFSFPESNSADTITLTRTPSGDGGTKRMIIQQADEGIPANLTGDYGDDWEAFASVDFNGETVEAYHNTNPDMSSATDYHWEMDLPYEVDGETLYFAALFTIEVDVDPDDVSEACQTTMADAATHLVESMEPNPDATVSAAE